MLIPILYICCVRTTGTERCKVGAEQYRPFPKLNATWTPFWHLTHRNDISCLYWRLQLRIHHQRIRRMRRSFTSVLTPDDWQYGRNVALSMPPTGTRYANSSKFSDTVQYPYPKPHFSRRAAHNRQVRHHTLSCAAAPGVVLTGPLDP